MRVKNHVQESLLHHNGIQREEQSDHVGLAISALLDQYYPGLRNG